MKTHTIIFIAILISSFTLFTGCEDKSDAKNMFSKDSKEFVEIEFTLKSANDEEIKILVRNPHKIRMKTKAFKNKAILLDFWATWCPPCIKEIPHLNSVSKKYKGKLELIGVLSEKHKSSIELANFIKKHNMQYTITTTDEDDANLNLLRTLTNLRTLPFKILYDTKGNYVKHYYGAIPEEMLDIDIQKAIKQ